MNKKNNNRKNKKRKNQKIIFMSFFMITALFFLLNCKSDQSIQFLVSPEKEVLLGDKIEIQVTGVTPEQEVKIHALRLYKEKIWYSHATFIADKEKQVDISTSESISGTYTGLDPTGLFWSMNSIDETQKTEVLSKFDNLEANVPPQEDFVYFSAEAEGKRVSSPELALLKMLPEVVKESVQENGLVAEFFYPQKQTQLPTVILIGGSGGGISWQSLLSGLLASKGYAALALAYFNMPGLPETLEEIPVEYFKSAVDWLSSRKEVDNKKIAVLGGSKGAELALLLGAVYEQIGVVIAMCPASVVFQGIGAEDIPEYPKSSWSMGGEPLPFVPIEIDDELMQQFYSENAKGIAVLDCYLKPLNNSSAVEKAVIKVENINGPVLLLSGSDDKMWPSKQMSEMVVERLKEHSFSFPYNHVSFEDAGHNISPPGYYPTTHLNDDIMAVGGNPQKNGRAQAEAWKVTLSFLSKHLKDNT